MTIIYIAAIILQLGVIIYFVRRNRTRHAALQMAEQQPELDNTTYEGARNIALSITAVQLKLAIPANEKWATGVIMDWNMGDVTVTLAAYITGAANVYFSSGGAIQGGGKDPVVGEAAADFVTLAKAYIDRAIPVQHADTPSKGCVRFFLLTNYGLYGAQEQMQYFEDRSSPWTDLFDKGNDVIAKIRG